MNQLIFIHFFYWKLGATSFFMYTSGYCNCFLTVVISFLVYKELKDDWKLHRDLENLFVALLFRTTSTKHFSTMHIND